ncbi:MAG: hypothetical protein H0V81_17490 [Solirubrobacterales bacterium]|nr:hypothetical protein [Solirubrobacterales bacterium]
MLLNATTALSDGARLRLRLPHRADRAGVRALLLGLGLETRDLDLVRALRFAPRERVVACATAFVGGTERVVAVGAIDLGEREPDLLVADESLAPGAGAALSGALRERSLRDAAA